eukprot:60446_1
MSRHDSLNQWHDSNVCVVDPIQLDDDYQSTDHMSSPVASRYRARLQKPKPKRRKITRSRRNSIILKASTTSDTEEPWDYHEVTASSTKSMPHTMIHQCLPSFTSDRDTFSHSDRFIPSRFSSNRRDCFNMSDKFNHSPLSLMRNQNKKRKSMDHNVIRTRQQTTNGDCDPADGSINIQQTSGYTSDSSSSFQKYDECLQSLLLPTQHSSSSSHIIPKNEDAITNPIHDIKQYHHHLQECAHFNTSNTNEIDCVCKYILTQRLNYNESPRKVLKFDSIPSEMEGDCNDNNTMNISCLPNKVQSIMRNNKNRVVVDRTARRMNENVDNANQSVSIPSEPIKNIELRSKHKYKQLANDYYYHLMDFKINQNLGCIAIKDSLHIIRGHFGDLDHAEDNKYVQILNKNENISRKDYHFCSIKLSPNSNSQNAHVLCLGDNFGRLLFYDYVRGMYVACIHKTNECRISVIDWKNHYNARNGMIAAGSLDKNIRIYDDRSYQQIDKLKYHRGEVCGLRWNKYNEYLLLSGGNQNMVCCWDIRKNRNPLFVGKHKAAIRALTWFPDCDDMFISGGGSNDQCIKIWNINEKKEKLSLMTGSQVCNLECLEYDKQNYLVSSHGFSSNSVIIWNMNRRVNHKNNRSDIMLTRIKQLSGHKCRVLYLSKYSDCNIVSASAGPDQTIKYWKIFPKSNQSPFVHHIQNVIR